MTHLLTNEMLYLLAASAAAVTAAVKDLSTRRIPNWITGISALLGLALHWWLDGLSGLGSSALAGLLLGGIFFVLYLAGGMGAGDVKLMAGIGCLAGQEPVQTILISTVVCGMLLALSIALYRRQLRHTLSNTLLLLQHHRQRGLRAHNELNIRSHNALNMPYAVPIAAGCLISFGIEISL